VAPHTRVRRRRAPPARAVALEVPFTAAARCLLPRAPLTRAPRRPPCSPQHRRRSTVVTSYPHPPWPPRTSRLRMCSLCSPTTVRARSRRDWRRPRGCVRPALRHPLAVTHCAASPLQLPPCPLRPCPPRLTPANALATQATRTATTTRTSTTARCGRADADAAARARGNSYSRRNVKLLTLSLPRPHLRVRLSRLPPPPPRRRCSG